ncbi:immunoglobulin lambda-1 light chain-like [Chiloscyllium punctatum]|uniref:Ig-like domain-containing protein n=1 Tax=Chiloscyllium punctatum TaxID=137246 RepID=A0A401T7N4_CHIPU|nr:hypothetical protein [Chiloscyllium punctatum]
MGIVFMMSLLLLCFTSVSPNPVLLQPESAFVSPGTSVSLSCTVKNRDISDRWLRWYRQRPGMTPEWILTHKSTNDGGALFRGSEITDRFTHSRNDPKNTVTLTINNVELKDSAVYYCSIYANAMFLGNGTELHMIDWKLQVPSLELFPPSHQELTSAEMVTLTCLAHGFYPGFVDMIWKVGESQTQSGVTTSFPKLESDNSYTMSSYLMVPVSDWNAKEEYSCLFKYKSQDTLVQKSISLNTCHL